MDPIHAAKVDANTGKCNNVEKVAFEVVVQKASQMLVGYVGLWL